MKFVSSVAFVAMIAFLWVSLSIVLSALIQTVFGTSDSRSYGLGMIFAAFVIHFTMKAVAKFKD